MIVRFDALNRFESPLFTLCNPGSEYTDGTLSRVVGMLIDHEAEEIVFNFNATSELNMRVNKVLRDDPDDNRYAYSMYRSIQNRRLIFVENIGYFMITGVDDGYSNGIHYKDIQAKSIDFEIAQKMIPYIANGTYRFKTSTNGSDKGILETIVETLPLWTIGHVDDDVAQRWRTFEDVDITLNCLAFMLQNLQDAYECIFVFDNITRTINVYDQANYVRQTNIHITKEDLINTLEVTENADDLYTAISVTGGDNITISAINPLGTNVIYDFSYYVDWMSGRLGEKVVAWQKEVENAGEEYYNLNLAYYKKLTDATNMQMEIDKIDAQLTMYSRCRDNIVAEKSTQLVGGYNDVISENGGTKITIYPEIEDTLKCIDDLVSKCENDKETARKKLAETQSDMDKLRNQIEAIHNELSMSSHFTEEEYEELCQYVFEGSYDDEYVTITDIMTQEEIFEQMNTLYKRAMQTLHNVSKPTQEFNVDVENFIFCKEFQNWSEQLETGCLINVELETNDIAALFLSNITINYDDHTLKMTFGNRFNKFDTKSLFDDVLGQIAKSANTLSFIKDALYPIKSGEFDAMQEALQTSRNLTMGAALSSKNEEVIIDGSGYTGRRLLSDGTYDPQQVKLTGKSLVFTDDAWESCKVAIGELLFGDGSSAYGINAQTIIGDIIMGRNLKIVDSDGNDLLTVMDGKIATSVGNINGRLSKIEQNEKDFKISIENLEKKDVTEVKTTTGYTFDANGLTIHKSGDEITNLLDNTGMYVNRGDDNILTANHLGVNAINLTANQYLIVGLNSRFENYANSEDSKRTGCFFVGNSVSTAVATADFDGGDI